MTRPYTNDIVAGNPYLDEVIVYDKDGVHRSVPATLIFARGLKRYNFDIALILHSTLRTNLIAFIAGIPVRIGYARKAGWLLTIRLSYVKSQGTKHEMEYTLDIARQAGIPCDSETLRPYLPISLKDHEKAADFLKKNGITEDDVLVGIHPSASCPSRRWSARRFAEVADRLAQEKGYKIIVLGVGEDLKFANMVRGNAKYPPLVVSGFTIPQIAAILGRCRFFISTDTGPAHIARAMGTPCITIFGRKQPGLSPVRWRPLGEEVVVLHKDVGCSECLAHRCKRHFACLEAVTVDEVMDAVRKFY
jgi:heptosyltransferase-2